MSRPMYESQADRQNEDRIASRLCAGVGIEFHKLPIRYEVDYMLRRRGTLYGWLEVKHRPGVERYQTIMLSAQKVLALLNLSRAFGGRALFAVGAGDAVLIADLARVESDIRWGGRNDRGDDQDMEPVCHFPLASFIRMTT